MNYPTFEPKEGDNFVRILASEDGTFTLIDREDATIKTWSPTSDQCSIHHNAFWGETREYDISIFVKKDHNPSWAMYPHVKKSLSSNDDLLIALSGDPLLNHLKKDCFKQNSKMLLHCHFCHKTHKDVQTLIATEDDIGICEACIRISYDLAAKKLNKPTINELEAKLEKALAPREKSYFEKLANR